MKLSRTSVIALCLLPPAISGAAEPDAACPGIPLLPPGGVYRLTGATAAPGEEVRLSLLVTPDWDVRECTISLDFDEEALEVKAVERVFRVETNEWAFSYFDHSNQSAVPGNAGVCDEGFIAILGGEFGGINEQGLPNLPLVPLPAQVETELVSIVFRVRPDAAPGPSPIRFQDGAPDRRPPLEGKRIANGFNGLLGEGRHTVDVLHGSITVKGPPVDAPAPRRFNLAGLSGLITTLDPGADGPGITMAAPAGDVDGDGREDLLLRSLLGSLATGEESVVLLYGFTGPRGSVDPFRSDLRKTRFHTPAARFHGQEGLSGGEDLDADGLDDFLVATGPRAGVQPSTLYLVYGSRDLPGEVRLPEDAPTSRWTAIVDSAPAVPTGVVGALAAMSPDLNGDRTADLVIGETADLTRRWRAFIVFGSRSLPASIDLQEVGARVPGAVLQIAGNATDTLEDLAALGDIDGDALADLGLVTGRTGHVGSSRYLGFLVYGREDLAGVLALDGLGAEEAVRLPQYEALARGGDVDGDGLEDPLLFQIRGAGDSGEAHLLRGRPRDEMPAEITLSSFHAESLGLALIEERDLFGTDGLSTSPTLNLTRGSDLDGDGRAEVFVASKERSLNYDEVGIHLAGMGFVFKAQGPLVGRLATGDLAYGQGAQIDGFDPEGTLGYRLHVIRGFSGDGPHLLLVAWRDGCGRLVGQPGRLGQDFKVVLVPAGAVLGDLPPRLERIVPDQSALAGGDRVLLLGSGFRSTPEVYFGDTRARVVEAKGEGVLLVVAPQATSPGAVKVRVRNGRGETGQDVWFTYLDHGRTSLDLDAAPERVFTARYREPIRIGTRGIAVGDYNADSHLDLATAHLIQPSGGEVRFSLLIIFGDGKRRGPLDLSERSPPGGVRLWIPPNSGVLALQGGGDVNADGADDLILNVNANRKDEWHLVLGRREFVPDSTLEGPDGLVRFIHPSASFDTGGASRIVKDLNGDGIDDFILTGTLPGSEQVIYLVRGRRDPFPEEVDLSTLEEDGLGAVYSSTLGLTDVAGSAGDFNGDGFEDLFFGGAGAFQEGAVLVLYGGPGLFPGAPVMLGPGHLRDAGGVLISGPALFTGVDFFAAPAGDLDGDGSADLFLRQNNLAGCTLAPGSGTGFIVDREAVLRHRPDPGEFPLIEEVYQREPTGLPDLVISANGGQQGILRLEGTPKGYGLGVVASPAGDFNGDGLADLAIGSSQGGVSVVYGAADLKSRDLELPDFRGRALNIRASARFLEGGFDWDRDGLSDLALGSAEGTLQVVFGEAVANRDFIRGDSDRSGRVDVSDPIFVLGYLFLGNAHPRCLDALDADDDGEISLTDAVVLLSFLFLGGPDPAAPYPLPGSDPTGHELSCSR